jgi:transcriptional regulator with XRE-family HTH domain
MPIDTAWFSQRMADRQLSQRQLAKLMGVDPAAVNRMLLGKRRMTLEEAAQIAVLLNSTTTDVLTAAGVSLPSDNRVRLVGYVGQGGKVTMEAEGLHDMVDAPPGLGPDAIALQARHGGQEDGWVYFLADGHAAPDRAVGSLSLVAVKDNGLVLANVRRGYRAGTYNLSGGHDATNVGLAWASPVLWIKTHA